MKRIPLRIVMAAVFLLVSCSGNPGTPASPVETIPPAATGETGIPAETPVTPSASESAIPLRETPDADCGSEEIKRIGQSIAEPYAFTTVEEVMSWFCDGAEFEDILVALETEELNGTAAEEMLEMRAEGFSWEDIWMIIGFVEP